MSNIAVISLAGAQHLVEAGDKLEVNRLEYDIDKDTSADVLLSTKGDAVLVNEGDVKFKVLTNKLGVKLNIVKFKAKSRYRRKAGHRQKLSLIEILSINGETKTANAKATKTVAKVEESETKVETKTTKKTVAKPASKAKVKAPVKKVTKK